MTEQEFKEKIQKNKETINVLDNFINKFEQDRKNNNYENIILMPNELENEKNNFLKKIKSSNIDLIPYLISVFSNSIYKSEKTNIELKNLKHELEHFNEIIEKFINTLDNQKIFSKIKKIIYINPLFIIIIFECVLI